MDESLLKQIQPTVAQYANVISNVIHVEVEIVDNNLIRIASTEIYKDKIDQNISVEGYVYRYVLKTGQCQIIEKPGYHELCVNCVNRYNCVEKLELCTPIKLNDDIIGVIGLICLTDEQKKYVLDNINSHLQFLDQIAEFISAKVYENMEKQRNASMIKLLKEILNNINKGILVIDTEGRIRDINNSAKVQLKLTSKSLNKKIEIESNKEYIMGGEVFLIKVDNKKHNIIGNVIPVSEIFPQYDKIIIFDKTNKLKKDFYNATNIRQSITMDNIIGKSDKIINIKEKIKRISSSNSTVLITGESGTGKELFARAIHAEGNRKSKPFVAINCGAIPDTLLESELFGYVKGAFTGADPNGKIGKFELANEGVIFLDEIGDMPLYLQVKLLRVLQEMKIVRIGSNKQIELDIRVIAATNKDLKRLIKENKFREDLFYRLNVIPIELPPLRERKEDIEPIMMELIYKYNSIFKKNVHGVDEDVKEIFLNYPWAGNVRELENTIEFMMNFVNDKGILTKNLIPKTILHYKGSEAMKKEDQVIKPLKTMEKEYILKVLDLYGYDTKGKKRTAEALGIGIATLYRKLN